MQRFIHAMKTDGRVVGSSGVNFKTLYEQDYTFLPDVRYYSPF
ncbi:MAG: hypothetical protein ACO1Q7_05745 [Gemmatimonas sp.]